MDADLEADAPDDLRGALEAALAESEVAPATEGADQEPRQRARAADGKFAKAEDEAPADVEAAAPEVETAPTEKPAEEKGVEPPTHWSAADKEMFKGIPPEAQTFLLDRHKAMEADYTRSKMEIAAFKRDYGPVAEMFAPHEAALRQSGYTPASLIKAWANVEQDLMAGKGVSVIKSIAEQYKIDKAAIARELGLASSPAPGVEQPPAPQGQAPAQLPPELVNKIQSMEQFIAQQTQERQEMAARSQREAESRVMSAIDSFKDAKDASGNLLHPHFSAVEDQMTRLAVAARASGTPVPSLDELYDQAVWANTSTRQAMFEAQRAADEAQRKAADAERAKEARAKAERAKRAASSVTGSPSLGQPGGRSVNGEASIRDSLLAAFEEVQAA